MTACATDSRGLHSSEVPNQNSVVLFGQASFYFEIQIRSFNRYFRYPNSVIRPNPTRSSDLRPVRLTDRIPFRLLYLDKTIMFEL